MQPRKYSVKSTPTKSKRNKSHKLEEVHDFSTMISVKINYGHGILSTQMSQVLLFLALITLQSKILKRTSNSTAGLCP